MVTVSIQSNSKTKRIFEENFYCSAHHAVAEGVERVKGLGERE